MGVPPFQAVFRALKHDTTTNIKEQFVLYAYSMLNILLLGDKASSDIVLKALGLSACREELHTAFPKSFFPAYFTRNGNWWYEFHYERNSKGLHEVGGAFLVALNVLRLLWEFCETTKVHFGLAPPYTRQSDVIYVPNGYRALVSLRRVHDKISSIGDCFIVGLMNGERKED
jgi:hypothetical protein